MRRLYLLLVLYSVFSIVTNQAGCAASISYCKGLTPRLTFCSAEPHFSRAGNSIFVIYVSVLTNSCGLVHLVLMYLLPAFAILC